MLGFAIAGCGGTVIDPGGGGGSGGAPDDGSVPTNPLDGTWSYSEGSGDTEFDIALTFSSEGSVREALTVSNCTGTETIGGLSWTSTATTITLSGSPSCTGSLQCRQGEDVPCSTIGASAVQSTCTYALSNADDTLTLSHCSESSGPPANSRIVLTRQ